MSRLLTLKRRGLRWGPVRRARAVRELGVLVRVLARSALFDQELYESQRGRPFRTAAAAAYDYVVVGSRQGLVAGPLLLPPVSAVGRRPGAGPASWWASQVRALGFPRTSAHPLHDAAWCAAHLPLASSWRGGPLAYYTERGRFDGARLGPLDPGTHDLVDLGRSALLGAGPPPVVEVVAVTGRTAAVLVAGSAREVSTVLPVVLDESVGVDEVVVVSSPVLDPESRLVAQALALLAPRVVVLCADRDPDVRAGRLLASAASEAVLVVTEPVDLTAGTLLDLLTAVREGAADAAGPVVLEADDTVRAAGVDEAGARRLAGWPLADAERDGNPMVHALSGEVVVLGPAGLAAAASSIERGPIGGALEAVTAAVSAAGGRVEVLGGGQVNIRVAVGGVPVPSAEGAARRPAYADPVVPGVLRWAIKSAHPAGPRRRTWGDFHVARALAAELEGLGHHVAVDPLESWYRSTAYADDVTLTLRGLHRFRPSKGQVSLLWVISHPELVSSDELAEHDLVLAASRPWAERRSAAGVPVVPLLQCTDARVFRPDVAEPGTGPRLLFVGNSRSASRPLVEVAARTRPELTVIGGGWAGRLPDAVVSSEHVANSELPALYRSAGVVLNDHWPQMAAEGFLSNRLFDLTAAGARWVSDPAEGLLEVFPQGRVARDAAELGMLLDGAPGTFPTEGELQEASARVRELHSFEARARTLDSLVSELMARRRR